MILDNGRKQTLITALHPMIKSSVRFVSDAALDEGMGNFYSSLSISSILIADIGIRVPGPKIAATPAL